MPIRNATVDDVEQIRLLISELAEYERLAHEAVATADDLRTHLFGPTPSAHVLMAESDDGEVVGFALWYPTFSTFMGRPGIWLEDLFVRPQHRHKGFGLALLQRLRSLTEGRVEWSVLDWNEPSIRFYRALGAEPVDGWTRYRWLPPAEPDRPSGVERPAGP